MSTDGCPTLWILRFLSSGGPGTWNSLKIQIIISYMNIYPVKNERVLRTFKFFNRSQWDGLKEVSKLFRVDASIYFLYKIDATMGDAANYEDTSGKVCFLASSGHWD